MVLPDAMARALPGRSRTTIEAPETFHPGHWLAAELFTELMSADVMDLPVWAGAVEAASWCSPSKFSGGELIGDTVNAVTMDTEARTDVIRLSHRIGPTDAIAHTPWSISVCLPCGYLQRQPELA